MANSIKPSDLGEAIAEQLHFYHDSVLEEVNAAGERAIKKLVKLTKKSAPKRTGDYRKAITYTESDALSDGDKEYTWGVKAPHHRLTHLLVKGHPTSTGGRTKADPFLADALDIVLPEYEAEVEEALKNAE